MDIFVARQPIFDVKKHVYAYELLYRAGEQNQSNVIDGISHFQCRGKHPHAYGSGVAHPRSPCIHQFYTSLDRSGNTYGFSKDLLVVEILEDIVPDKAFIESCKRLKDLGYTLALDDFVLDYPYDDIVDIVDIIKVDFC